MKRNATSPRPVSDNQVVSTPEDFLLAVRERYCYGGPLWCDLAATSENAKAPRFINPEMDSLTYPWPLPGKEWGGQVMGRYDFCWLNPPFANIAPWVAKAAECMTNVLVLVPASVGSNWFGEHIIGKAACVHFLAPRLKFTKDPYPKDLMLLEYWGDGLHLYEPTQFKQWRWK